MADIQAEDVDMEISEVEEIVSAEPIVISLKKKKKKRKQRYSKGLEEIQSVERHITRASHRVAQAAEKGIGSYRKESKKSADKKRDGAIRDFIPNSGLAISRALEEASPAVYDIAQVFDTKQNRRRFKRQLRTLSRTLRMKR